MKLVSIVLTFLVGLWLTYQWGFWQGKRQSVRVREVEVVHHYDTIVSEIPVPQVVVKQIPREVDTAAILAMHFQEVRYRDTIKSASVNFVIDDVVSQNRLMNRVVTVDGIQPVVYRNSLVMSAYVGRNVCSLMAGIRHRRYCYQAGYDFNNRAFMVGLSKEVFRW